MDNCTTCIYNDTKSGKGKPYHIGVDSIRFEGPDRYFCMKKQKMLEVPETACTEYEPHGAEKEETT